MPQRLRHALFMHGVRRMDRRHLRFARRRQKQRVFPSALAAAPDQSARFQLVRHADQICPLQAQRDRIGRIYAEDYNRFGYPQPGAI